MSENEKAVITIAPHQEFVEDEKLESEDFTAEMRAQLAEKAARDPQVMDLEMEFLLDKVRSMTVDEATNILNNAILEHLDDPNFPIEVMQKIQKLVQGEKSSDMEGTDYLFNLKMEAVIIYYWSPYPEVRSVTSPIDSENDTPIETIRAWFLGLCLMAGASALNTFFSPRQPSISIGTNVLQLLLAPSGQFLSRVLPDWGFNVFGRRISLNPGPWTSKEQIFATIIFNVANGPGFTYYTYLVQKMPQFLGNTWVTFGYEILLALSIQTIGFGYVGFMRRICVYPVRSIWFRSLPVLAVNKALMAKEKRENVFGWTLTRYKFFVVTAVAMFIWFWVPNFLFTALHGFNWMTWINPQNFALAMVTGFYGGMGYNPWATFDWNVSGTGMLVTPFFSTLQQYIARFISGIIIIAMYWTNFYWAGYTPINSNEVFTNTGQLYNVSKILGTNGQFNQTLYQNYSPPYYSSANVFGYGNFFAWYPMTLFYVMITEWDTLKSAGKSVYVKLRRQEPAARGLSDPFTRAMLKYDEVPDWWFLVILLVSLVFGIVALAVYPTGTPVWSIFTVLIFSIFWLFPSVILTSVANVSIYMGVLFQLLGSAFFVGRPDALIIFQAYGTGFDAQTQTYIVDQKMAHYAKIPPRAIFRGQVIAVVINCFIFIGLLNWLVNNFAGVCEWNQPQRFVCTDAVLNYANAIEFGAFGVKKMFKLYPLLPWCFLIGTIIGLVFGFLHRYGRSIRDYAYRNWSEARFEWADRHIFRLAAGCASFNPAVFWSGSMTWTGGNNLSYATNGLYVSFIFMYWVKRRYVGWWEKYNYLLEAGFDVGIALSAIVQFFALSWSGISLKWWGNSVATQGLDFASYNQEAPLLPIPSQGYFGPAPGHYP